MRQEFGEADGRYAAVTPGFPAHTPPPSACARGPKKRSRL